MTLLSDSRLRKAAGERAVLQSAGEEGVRVSTAWRDDYNAIMDFETARRKAMGRYRKK